MRRILKQLTVAVGPILLQLQLRVAEIQFQYKALENKKTISINCLKRLQSNINDLKHFIEFHKIKATWDELKSTTDHITEKQYLLIVRQHIAAHKELEDHKISFITHLDKSYLQCYPDYETQSGKLPSFDNFWFLLIIPKYNTISYTTFTVAYFIRAQESEASFLERDHLLKYLLRKIVITIRYRDNILKEFFDSIADKLYQIWVKTKQFQSWKIESHLFREAMKVPRDDTASSNGISFFDNTNELKRGGTPSRIRRRVTFNTRNDRRSPSSIRVENVQQLVASTLSSNQSSRLSNLRVTTPSVGNTNSGSSLENPYNFSQATQYSRMFNPLASLDPLRNSNFSTTSSFTTANWQPVNNRWLESNSNNRGNNTMGYQNVTTKRTPQSTTSVPSSQLSNNINTSQPILTSQPAIVPVGGNNDNVYL
ncbi:14322_t:CDS:2 [Funneliformis caledonium]|uniref:14322_t:CDS:1 n=1 Tax=Funneliformis caledonium TaxID=1117310 RepID=A0A9N9E6M5_9GLOM|nr:14322_t:CDS:2 [Funneliformis caledonium]